MKKRKRLTVSLDVESYERMQRMCRLYGIESCPTLIVAFSHLFLECMADADKRRYNMADGDREYIQGMFKNFGHAEQQPDGSVPKRGHKTSKEYGEG